MLNMFFKVVCVSVDIFGYTVHKDVNLGTMKEVCEYTDKHLKDYPNSKWMLYPMKNNIILEDIN